MKTVYWLDQAKDVVLMVADDPFDGRGYSVYRAKPIKHRDTRALTRHKHFPFTPTQEASQAALDLFAQAHNLAPVDKVSFMAAEDARGRAALPHPELVLA
jgi:hypothetical protein